MCRSKPGAEQDAEVPQENAYLHYSRKNGEKESVTEIQPKFSTHQFIHPSIHSFIQCQPVSTWILGCRGWCNSYQRTQMNLRGWSCWMLPSRPDLILCEAGSLPLGQGAIAAFRALRRRRCLHVTAISGCLTSPTISCLAGQSTVHRPSGAASRCPALGGEELPPPPRHARKEEGREAREGGKKVQDLFWWHV